MLKRLRPDLLILAGLFLLPVLLYFPVTLGGRTMVPADNLFTFEPWKSFAGQFGVSVPHNGLLSDLLLENYAWKRFALQALQGRELPLWNPHQFAGMPFLADGQHSALYPFSVLFYLLPLWLAYGWFTVSQLFLAGANTYFYLRVLHLPRAAALLGAVVYQLGQFMVVSAVFPMILAGAAWLPLLLACIELVVQQRPAPGGRPATLPWVALGALAFGMQILAGHPEVIYYSGLIMAAYAACRLLADLSRKSVRRRAGMGPFPPLLLSSLLSSLLRPSLFLLSMIALGAGVGAVQLVPLVDLVRYNFRTGSASFEQILAWAYPVRHLLALLAPNFYGNPAHHRYFDLFSWRWTPAAVNAPGERIDTIFWGVKNYVEGGAYVGLLPWLLAVIGVAAWAGWRRRTSVISHQPSVISYQSADLVPPSFPVPFFAALALLALLFAFGTRAYALIFWLPGINQLHSPFRWVWPLSLCVAALAGYGLAALQQAGEEVRRTPPATAPPRPARLLLQITRVAAALAMPGGGLTLLGLLAAWLFYDRIAGAVEQLFLSLALAPQAFADGRMFFSYEAPWVALFALLLAASGAVLWWSTAERRPYLAGGGAPPRPRWKFAAIALVALDLFLTSFGFNAAADRRILDFTPPAVQFLRDQPGPWRFTTYAPGGRKVMLANTGWLFDLYDNRGYGSIIPRQYAAYMRAIEPQGDLDYNQIGPIYNAASLDSPLLDLLNVRYVLSEVAIESSKYRLVYDGELKIYQNLAAMPRAFTLPRSAARLSPDPLADLRTYDPRQVLLLEDAAAPLAGAASRPGSPVPARVEAHGPNQVSVSAGLSGPGYLVLADSYFDGWRAFVRPAGSSPDQELEVPIYRAYGNFRAVALEAGAWTVRFKYSPFAVKLGGFITAISLLALLFLAGAWLWRHFYRESALDSTARRVAKNSLAPMALNLMNRGIDLVFAAFYLRVLGPADAGAYSLAIVVIGWFEIWTNFGLNTLLTREVSRDREHANRYLSNTTLFRLALGALSFPLLLGLMLGWQRWLGLRGDTVLAVMLLAVGMAPASISTGLTALFYAYEQAEYPAAIATVTTLLKVTSGALALLLGYGFVGLAGVSILTNAATMALLGALAWRLFFRPRFELDRGLQREMVRESFPLMLNHLLATLFFKVDVPLLEIMRGEREVGWYSTAYKFIDAFNIIPAFFTMALFPVMSRQAREDRPALRRSYALAVKLLVAVALPLAVITALLARPLIGLLAGAEFLPHGAIALSLIVWSIPIGWINSVTNYLLVANNQQRDLTRAFFLALLFNVIANLIFLPLYGYRAAAIITILSELFEGMAFYHYLRRGLGPIPWPHLLWRLVLPGGAMAAVAALPWGPGPVLALPAALTVYVVGIWRLRPLEPDELAVLRAILPARLRRGAAADTPA